MLKHYLKIGIRNFLKHKSSSLINAFGLSMAIGCSIFVFQFLNFFLNVDSYHENAEQIFAVNRNMQMDGYQLPYAGAPDALGSFLKDQSAQITHMSRYSQIAANIRHEEKVFNEIIQFVDADFLDMFSFPLTWGQASDLNEPDAIILSEKMAEKYFNEANPVGEIVSIKFFVGGKPQIVPFTVKGVTEEFNKNSSFTFSALINYNKYFDLDISNNDNWGGFNNATFVLLENPGEIGTVKALADEQVSRYNDAQDNFEAVEFLFEPLTTCSFNSQKTRHTIFKGTAMAAFITLSTIAILMLTMACINYMNIAVASAAYRLKEIGLRKVIGGARKQLIIQFFVENMIICFVALLFGIVWAEYVFLNGIHAMIGENPFTIDYVNNPNIYYFFAGILFFTAIGGAAYPAFYISNFQPTAILKDKIKFGSKNVFRKVLLGFQYFFSFVSIACAIVLIRNNAYQTELAWGYEQGGLITIEMDGENYFEKYKQQIQNNPNVQLISGGTRQIGGYTKTVNVEIDQEKYFMDEIKVGPEYLETMGLPLISGRSFDRQIKTDETQSIIINETFADELGWTEPLGKALEIEDQTFYVIGVVKDFHYKDFGHKIGSLMIRVTQPENFGFLVAKVRNETLLETGAELEKSWKALFPDDPFTYYYQDSVFDGFKKSYSTVTAIISTAGSMAIILAAIGLFGLSSLSIKAKFKEISIRKVLGGQWSHLAFILNKEYILLLGGAAIVAGPVSYFAVKALLSTLLLYTLPASIWPYLFTAALLLILSLLAVGGHVFRAVTANPTESLRTE